jgi:hypothetical protein
MAEKVFDGAARKSHGNTLGHRFVGRAAIDRDHP